MSVILNKNRVVPNDLGRAVVETSLELPGKLTLHLLGKLPSDTELDADGNVIADKCVQLVGVRVDQVRVPELFLKTWPILNNSIHDNYFGFNGVVELNFNAENSFYWLLATKR